MKKIDATDAVYLAQVAGVFCDPKLRDDSQKFFDEQKLPGSQRILQNAKDQVNACIQVRDLQQQNLAAISSAKPPHSPAYLGRDPKAPIYEGDMSGARHTLRMRRTAC